MPGLVGGRYLVNHVVVEDRWTVPPLEGHTIEEVGTDLDGDLLGAHVREAVQAAAAEAVELVAEVVPAGGRCTCPYGEEEVEEYVPASARPPAARLGPGRRNLGQHRLRP